MKFNIELELGDIEIWHDETTLEEEVVKSIRNEVVDTIKSHLREQIREEIEIRCERFINNKFSTMVNGYFNEYIQNEKFEYEDDKGTLREETFGEWIKAYLNGKMKGYFYGGFDASVKKVAEEFAKQLKQAYDLKFAAIIVKNMAEQHLLKDDELAKLIPGEK